jgi:aminopeptidase-like protein
MHRLLRELFPIPRSLTGEGVRETLRILGRELPVEPVETPTGTRVFDWTVPQEWRISDAWIETPDGRRVGELSRSSLHVVHYSVPVDATIPLDELLPHVHVHESRPEAVPYRTSYYARSWGFCLSRLERDTLPPGDYRVRIDSELVDGQLTYGEASLPGEGDGEFLLTTYVCHPSLANDNLSGVVLLWMLGRILAGQRLRHSYRLLWSPGTIGPLCWLARNRGSLAGIRHGLVVSSAGDPGPLTYKRSRRGDADIDRIAAHVLGAAGAADRVRDWSPYGGDERQFCSPGFDLPVGALSRTPADEFPEYHSSADDLDLVTPAALEASLRALLAIVEIAERNETYVNRSPYGEPQLGRRGLYRSIGGTSSAELALLWVLSLSDGSADLLQVAERSGLPFAAVRAAADSLLEHDLIGPTASR